VLREFGGAQLLVMLACISTGEASQQWLGVGELMRAEARDEVEKRLDHYSARARHLAGIDAERVIREGSKADEIQKLIEEDPDISILVLASQHRQEGARSAGFLARKFPFDHHGNPDDDRAGATDRRRARRSRVRLAQDSLPETGRRPYIRLEKR
jgi:hypothetical protein